MNISIYTANNDAGSSNHCRVFCEIESDLSIRCVRSEADRMKTVLYREVIEAMRRCVADFDHLESNQESESDDTGHNSELGIRRDGMRSDHVRDAGDSVEKVVKCLHDEDPAGCDACMIESDFQADIAQEKRHFGR